MGTWEDGHPGGGQGGPDGDRRGLEQAMPGGTQDTAIMSTHGGADGGRSHGGGKAFDSRGPTNGSGVGGGGARGREPMSQGDGKDWRAKAEQMATVTEAEVVIRKAVVESERQRTEEEPEGRRSLTELEGQRDEV